MVKSGRRGRALSHLAIAPIVVAALIAAKAHAHELDAVRAIEAQVVGWTEIVAPRRGRAVEIEDLFTLRELGTHNGGLALSPDGRHLAVMEHAISLTDNAHRYELVVVDTASSAAERVRVLAGAGGFLALTRDGRRSGGPFERNPAWSPDGSWIAYIAEVEGRAELWRVHADGGAPEAVAALAGDIARFAWAGERLVVETLTPRAELLRAQVDASRLGFRVDERFDPGYAQTLRPDDRAGLAVWVVDPSSHEARPATDAEAAQLDRGADGTGSRAQILPRDPTLDAAMPEVVLEVVGAEGVRIRCAATECTGAMENAWAVENGQRVLFTRLENARAVTALYAWSPADGRVRLMRRRTDERLVGCVTAPDEILCLQEGAARPVRLVTIPWREPDRTTEVLYDPNRFWSAIATSRIDRIETRDSDGSASFAHLVYPLHWRPGRRYPLVIVQYRSRGFLLGGTGREYPIHPLAARGYFVLSVDRPEAEARARILSWDALQAQTERDGTETAIKVAQIEALIAALIDRRLVDPQRIAITGMSDGAETVYAMINRGNDFAAAVVSSPPSDPISWSLMSRRFQQSQIAKWGFESPWRTDPSPWAPYWRRAAIFHAEHYATPILFNISESEILYALPLMARLREGRRPFEAYVYPGAYHVKSSPLHLLSARQRAVAWIDFWLRGVDDAPADDPERIERWREMQDAFVRPSAQID